MRQEVENPMVNDKLWNDGEKHGGTDYKGNEVFIGEEVYHDPELDEIIMKDDLMDYLTEKYGIKEIIVE